MILRVSPRKGWSLFLLCLLKIGPWVISNSSIGVLTPSSWYRHPRLNGGPASETAGWSPTMRSKVRTCTTPKETQEPWEVSLESSMIGKAFGLILVCKPTEVCGWYCLCVYSFFLNFVTSCRWVEEIGPSEKHFVLAEHLFVLGLYSSVPKVHAKLAMLFRRASNCFHSYS